MPGESSSVALQPIALASAAAQPVPGGGTLRAARRAFSQPGAVRRSWISQAQGSVSVFPWPCAELSSLSLPGHLLNARWLSTHRIPCQGGIQLSTVLHEETSFCFGPASLLIGSDVPSFVFWKKR